MAMGKKRTQEEYDALLKEVNPTIIRVGDYIRMDIRTKHRCLKCGHEWDVFPSSLTGKKHSGCPICNGGTSTVIVGVNDMWTTNPELAKLLADPDDGYKYTQSTKKKVKWKCPDCGEITKLKAISSVKTYGLLCGKCSKNKSLPNKIMYNLLTSLNIEFEDEICFDWCRFKLNDEERRGIYDFYFELNGNKYIVEMDGYFHKNDNYMSNQSADMSQYIDSEKDRLAIQHGINIIRIPCIPSRTYVIKENILKSQLSSLLDLSKVNWNECFYKSTQRIVKDICIEYKNGATITELSQKYKKHIDTIRKYLDHGTTIGICDYRHDDNKSHVVCLNDRKYFDMIKDAGKYYNVTTASILLCCNHKAYNAGHGIDEDGLPLVFAYYNEYIGLTELDILNKIQQAVLFKYLNKMVICMNTKTIFKTAKDAEKWCGCRISGNLYESERFRHSGKHPVTKEELQWKKLIDYMQSTGFIISEISA